MLILKRYVALGVSLNSKVNTKVIWMLFQNCMTLFFTHLFVHAMKVNGVQCYVNPKILQNIFFYVPWKKESFFRFGISSGWTICFWQLFQPMLTLCFWLYEFFFFLSLSPAGCPDSLIKEVHHFRVLGDEQVGLDSEIRRSHLHTLTHTSSKQPSLSWSRLMRNPSSSWLSDRYMREALNWPICCSPMPFTKPSARNKTSALYHHTSHPCNEERVPFDVFLHPSYHLHQVFVFELFTPIGAVMRHLCKAPLGMFLSICFQTCCYVKWPLLTSVCILFVSLSPILLAQWACGPDVKTKFTLDAYWVILRFLFFVKSLVILIK